MRKIQRILVAVKSPGKQWSPAVAKATQIARATGACLELFHGIDTRIYVEALDTYEGGLAGFEALQAKSYEPLLEALAQKVRRHGVTYSALAPGLQLTPLPLAYWPILLAMILAYLALTHLMKMWLHRRFGVE